MVCFFARRTGAFPVRSQILIQILFQISHATNCNLKENLKVEHLNMARAFARTGRTADGHSGRRSDLSLKVQNAIILFRAQTFDLLPNHAKRHLVT